MKVSYKNYSFEYEIVDNKIIILECECPTEQNVVFPSTIDGIKVFRIDANCCNKSEFWCCATTIVVEDGIEEIGDNAFSSCCELLSLKLPSSIKKIGKTILNNSEKIKNIKIDNKNLFYSSFDDSNCIVDLSSKSLICAIDTTIIPESVAEIASDAYYNLKNISSITVPNSVILLQENCFNNCRKLTSLYIGISVKQANNCIKDCYMVNNIKVDDNNPFISYDEIVKNFVLKNQHKLTPLPLSSFDFYIQYNDGENKGEYLKILYSKDLNYLLFEQKWQRIKVKVEKYHEEALKELCYLMGYVKESLHGNSNNYLNRSIHDISGNVRFSFSSKGYSDDNKIINNSETFIRVISILEFLSPFELNLVRNIPIVNYSIDDVNYKYLTIPDVYKDMFDSYKKINNKKHPLDNGQIKVKASDFSFREKLKYIKIRKSNLIFENDLFKGCNNLAAIFLVDNCAKVRSKINDNLKNVIYPNLPDSE